MTDRTEVRFLTVKRVKRVKRGEALEMVMQLGDFSDDLGVMQHGDSWPGNPSLIFWRKKPPSMR